MIPFEERLRQERKRLKLTQAQFGKIGGVGKNAQRQYEKGERRPGTAYLEALAIIGVDTAYVLTGQRMPELNESLSMREKALVNLFRELSEKDKYTVQALSGVLADKISKKEAG